MLAAQGGVCAICGLSGERLCIDHNHGLLNAKKVIGISPGVRASSVRGLLCNNCNTAVGMVGESVETAESLIAYLLYWKTSGK